MLQYGRFLESLSLGVGVNRNSHDPLRLNVGFLLHQNVGFSRVFEFDIPTSRLGDELAVEDLRGRLRLTRTAQGIYVAGVLRARMELECVRCLTPIRQPLESEFGELYVYPAEKADDPVLAIPETAILNLSPLLRELMWLDVPTQPLCRDDCKGLCPVCGNNRNVESCDHPHENIDPRLAPLKALLQDS
jgi:uncharacterized protein